MGARFIHHQLRPLACNSVRRSLVSRAPSETDSFRVTATPRPRDPVGVVSGGLCIH